MAANTITTITPLNAEYGDAGGLQEAEGISKAPQYRLEIVANPTVPVIDINAEAPTQGAAMKLAGARPVASIPELAAMVRSQGGSAGFTD